MRSQIVRYVLLPSAFLITGIAYLAVKSGTFAGRSAQPARVFLPTPNQAGRAERPVPEPGAEKSESVSRLEQKVAGLEHSLQLLSGERGERPAPVARTALEPRTDIASRRARSEQLNLAIRDAFQTTFDAEAIDSSWRRDKEQSLRAAFGATTIPLEAVDCRDSMCRLEVDTSDPATLGSLNELMASAPFSGGSFTHPSARAGQTIAYVFRSGREQDIHQVFAFAKFNVSEH